MKCQFQEAIMYRCGNEIEVGDCVSIQVEIDTQTVMIAPNTIGLVLEINEKWSLKTPLITVKLPNDDIQQLPSNWCILCERKNG